MNKTLNTLFAALLLAGSASAFAASSVDLTVTGTITPSACTPALANGGVVKYDTISAKDLNVDTYTALGKKEVQLIVTCEAATLMALETKDNQAGTATENPSVFFGLGLINGTEKLGLMLLKMVDPIADNVPVRTISSANNGANWTLAPRMKPGILHSVADHTTVAPLPVEILTATLQVLPDIAPARNLTLTDDVDINGSVTLTVRYL